MGTSATLLIQKKQDKKRMSRLRPFFISHVSHVRLPAERLALAGTARVESAVGALNKVCELRVDALRRRDLHLPATVAAHVDRELRTDALTGLPERPDLLLRAVGCARVLAGRRDGSRVAVHRVRWRRWRAGVVGWQDGVAALGGQDAEGVAAGFGRRDGVVDVGLRELGGGGSAVCARRHGSFVDGDGAVGADLTGGDAAAAVAEDIALEVILASLVLRRWGA